MHPVTGDGRCLFRSVAAAVALRGATGRRAGDAEELVEADRLRNAAVVRPRPPNPNPNP